MGTTTWQLKVLEDWIEVNRPDDKQTAALPYSLSRSAIILQYHIKLARNALAEFGQSDGNGDKMFAAFASFDPDFSRAALAHEANIIATIHTVRNYADIFAQIVNTLVVPNPLTERDCSFSTVINALPESALKDGMLELNDSHWFRYLGAFSNISKHRRLLQSNPTATFDADNNIEVTGLRVEEFTYQFSKKEEAVIFPRCWGHDLLEESYTVYRRILELGQELNRHVIPDLQNA